MNIVHLTASRFFGGPERQMLGLAKALPEDYRSVFLSYSEGGRCRALIDEARKQGFEAEALSYDTPRFRLMFRELADRLKQLGASVLLCHTYKPNILGRLAARQVGIPAAAVSRGWTHESWRVGIYEALDRWNLRWMDRVVCVSEAQAEKVLKAGIPTDKVLVIRNAVDVKRFERRDPTARAELNALFSKPTTAIIGAAGRLSPEKGFEVLVEAARLVIGQNPQVGFVLFGDGPLREALQEQIDSTGLSERFILAGFRKNLDRFFPHCDIFAIPSYTEGLSNVALEACAAGVPIVATTAGGTPEIITSGVNGYLIPPADPAALADKICRLLDSETTRLLMAQAARTKVRDAFTFTAQSELYERCFSDLLAGCPANPAIESRSGLRC
jgi:glycosyltransferase involved in cell wall biosynthesis